MKQKSLDLHESATTQSNTSAQKPNNLLSRRLNLIDLSLITVLLLTLYLIFSSGQQKSSHLSYFAASDKLSEFVVEYQTKISLQQNAFTIAQHTQALEKTNALLADTYVSELAKTNYQAPKHALMHF
ncbi:hypothetical protein [Catenovulum sediminis]|uniref:hypothetical protein n=1 Tax=Catenovulum sediminis TaxID=1740262 RepID=UPI00118034B0|nr:hypothetical protein [Catenovulum sediminis]